MENRFITRSEFEKRLCQLFAQNRIAQYPRKRKDRHILLKSIVLSLENNKDYTKPEINEAIKSWLTGMFDPQGLDYVSLRRYLVDEGYLDRSRNGSRYWVMDPGPSAKWFQPDVDAVDPFKVVDEAKEDYDKSRRKRGEVRKKILDAATELFAEKGFEGASIRDIADKAGVTVPNIYYYFKDKQGLYEATLKTNVDWFMDLMSRLDDRNLTFRERFLALGKAKIRLFRENNYAIKLWAREWMDHGGAGVVPKMDLTLGNAMKWIEQMLADAMEKGEIRKMNPKVGVWYLLANAFLYGAPFLSKWKKNKEFEPPTDEEVEEFVDLIMKGLEK